MARGSPNKLAELNPSEGHSECCRWGFRRTNFERQIQIRAPPSKNRPWRARPGVAEYFRRRPTPGRGADEGFLAELASGKPARECVWQDRPAERLPSSPPARVPGAYSVQDRCGSQ